MTETNHKKPPSFFHTLRFKMIIIIIVALIVSFVVSLFVSVIGAKIIDNVLLDEDRITNQQIELLLSFADYVKENNVASTESEKFDEWLSEHGNASLTVFRESGQVLGDVSPGDKSTWYVNDGSTTIVKDSAFPFLSQSSKILTGSGNDTVYSNYDFMTYPIRFSDGVCSVILYNHIEQIYNIVLYAITATVYCLVLFFILLKYHGTLIKRIKSLSKQVSVVSKGNISSSVSMKGRDELSTLAFDVEHMRGTLEEQIISEKNAWKSNQELITSISHDIRTPLTTLIGYSDVLVNGQYKDDEQFNRYLKSCREKAYQLKSLTDELFGYFLVFGSPEVKANFQTENARILLEQLLGEPMADLRARGCDVYEENLADDAEIYVDVMLLKRIFDNIFSNINKYADLHKPVKAVVKLKGDYILIRFKNDVNKNNKHVESTKIGIKTCARLCEAMNMSYSYSSENGVYKTEMTIPVTGNEKEK